ncbi:MAG: hypothetical protein MUC29_14230 [Pyrinomonadaceae bacterium]|nr:hypothetical protein [Pyrinomonadaceae bacterium]
MADWTDIPIQIEAASYNALAIVFAIMGYAAYVSIGEAKIFGEKLWLGD